MSAGLIVAHQQRAVARGLSDAVHLVGIPYWQVRQHPAVMQQVLDGVVAEGVRAGLLIGTVCDQLRKTPMAR